MLDNGPRVPGITGRQAIPFSVSRPHGVAEPSAHRQVELARGRQVGSAAATGTSSLTASCVVIRLPLTAVAVTSAL